MSLAAAFCRKHFAGTDPDRCALVVDCSKKHRSGKVEGSSDLYDHTISDTVRAQQVIALGLATPEGFIPLANQFNIGKQKRQARVADFEDGRSEVARAYRDGIAQTASQLVAKMVKSAKRAGIKAGWLIGDSGYGLKSNIALALDEGMDALFLMKRDNTTYRIGGKMYNAKQLHALLHRKMVPTAKGRFRSFAFSAEINLCKKGEQPRWVSVQLMLSRPAHNWNKNGWVLSLCTNMEVDADRMIELYLMRWSIEVYFKECKQHLGWLTNQSANFVSSYASMHLSSIRYQLLLHAAWSSGQGSLVDAGRAAEESITRLCDIGQLWEWFTLMVFGWLDELEARIGAKVLQEIKTHLGAKVDEFIELAFQFDLNSPEPAATP